MSRKKQQRDTRFDYPIEDEANASGGTEPPEEYFWWHSGPVARSLAILDKLNLLIEERGRTDKTPGFFPFGVKIKVSDLTPPPPPGKLWDQWGPVGMPTPTEAFLVTKRTELHDVAREALRRAEERGLLPPPDT